MYLKSAVNILQKPHDNLFKKTKQNKQYQTIINYPNVSNLLLNIQLSSWLAIESLFTTSDKYYDPFTHVS